MEKKLEELTRVDVAKSQNIKALRADQEELVRFLLHHVFLTL